VIEYCEEEPVIHRGYMDCYNCGWGVLVQTFCYVDRAVLMAYCPSCKHLELRPVVDAGASMQ